MKYRFLTSVAMSLLLIGAVGCGTTGTVSTGQPDGAQANMVLDAGHSVYPYLIFYNEGSGPASDVQVLNAQTHQAITPLAMLKKTNGTLNMVSPPHPLVVQPGEGLQMQLTSQDALQYTVDWSEGQQNFSEKLILHSPDQIETH